MKKENLEFKMAWIVTSFTPYYEKSILNYAAFSVIVHSEKQKDSLHRKFSMNNKLYYTQEIKLPCSIKQNTDI